VKHKKQKHSDAKINRKTKQQPSSQFAAGHYVRRFEAHERICEFVFIICALLVSGMSALGAHKIPIIWTIGIAICAAIIAICFWLTDRELALVSKGSDVIQTIIPKPTISTPERIVPSPTPTPEQSPSPAISRPATALTPFQIVKEVRAARPFQREGTARTFVGIPVDWLLIFLSANRLPDRLQEKEERWQLLFRPKGDDNNNRDIIVELEIPIKGNEYLRGIDKGEMFRVKGVIKEIDAPLSSIFLDNVSFERDLKP
jgi:hypothetical protein